MTQRKEQGAAAVQASENLHKQIVDNLSRERWFGAKPIPFRPSIANNEQATISHRQKLKVHLKSIIDTPCLPGFVIGGPEGIYIRKQCLGYDATGQPRTAHFVLAKKGWRAPLILLGFDQNSSGSTRDRIPGIISYYQATARWKVCIVLDNNLWTDGFIKHLWWLNERVNRPLWKIMNPGELRRWLSAGAKYE